MKTAIVEGKEVKIGDWVGFKCDIEQGGQIKDINGTRLTLENKNGFYGEYIYGKTEYDILAKDCWLES
jgi:hypothetical protein